MVIQPRRLASFGGARGKLRPVFTIKQSQNKKHPHSSTDEAAHIDQRSFEKA
jgi:hypothetical protein